MPKIPSGDRNLICPLHRKSCDKVCSTCPWWSQVRGLDPQTGQEVDDWQCAIGWLPMLLIENSQQTRQSGAAIESFRNQMVRDNEETRKIFDGLPRGNVLHLTKS